MRRGAESKNDRGGVVVLEGCGRQERRGGLSFSSKPVRQERSGGGGCCSVEGAGCSQERREGAGQARAAQGSRARDGTGGWGGYCGCLRREVLRRGERTTTGRGVLSLVEGRGGATTVGGGGDIVVPPTALSASSVGYRVEGRFQFSLEAIDEQAFKGYDTVGLPYKKVVISLQNPGLRIRIQ